jgi:hypothetical protein
MGFVARTATPHCQLGPLTPADRAGAHQSPDVDTNNRILPQQCPQKNSSIPCVSCDRRCHKWSGPAFLTEIHATQVKIRHQEAPDGRGTTTPTSNAQNTDFHFDPIRNRPGTFHFSHLMHPHMKGCSKRPLTIHAPFQIRLAVRIHLVIYTAIFVTLLTSRRGRLIRLHMMCDGDQLGLQRPIQLDAPRSPEKISLKPGISRQSNDTNLTLEGEVVQKRQEIAVG